MDIATIIGDVFAAVIKGFFGLFAKTPEEKLGIAETKNENAAKTIHDLQVDKAVSDRVDGMSDAERLRLATAINSADKPVS